MPLPLRPNDDCSSDERPGVTGADEVPVHLDLLRADLYRLLDELARAPSKSHRRLAHEFERTWKRFKDATAPR